MKTDPESLFKKSLKSVAASFPVVASLSQWWSEMDSDAQQESIDEIKNEIKKFQNPIPFSHPKAKDALQLIYKKIEITKDVQWEVDDELRKFLEVLSLWEKQNFLSGQHALRHRWISVFISNPVFIMAVHSSVHGDQVTAELRHNVWSMIKEAKQGVHGEKVAELLNVPLPYVDALFIIFETEGKGWKSEEIGISYFSPDPDLY